MDSQKIRRNFLKYFKERNHTLVPSSPVVPHDDPTLLFTNAGMNQFKDVFLQKSHREYKAAATAQKCIRAGGKHNDLENVGHTSRHLTFFEMLGNFSFGSYFKKEAIRFAWEVSTQVFELDENRIWPTVFEDDDEALALWEAFVPASRITRLGEKDNFWAMGDTGPCGPCSELLYDRGETFGSGKNPLEDVSGERFLEFWNLVFMQFNKQPHIPVAPLPQPCIDTGAGLERILSLRMGVDTVFQTDLFQQIIHQVEEISGQKYERLNPLTAPAFHVIADHIRSLSFAIADGAQPSNLDRGYVLRKILRRAVRYGRMLSLQEPFLAKVLPALIHNMGDDYPELKTAKNRIAEILTLEEESFFRTLKRGGVLLQSVVEKAAHSKEKEISGSDAFKLKDTYGLPLDEIVLLAKDSELSVDLSGFEKLEKEAKEKSKNAARTHIQANAQSLFEPFVKEKGPCQFVGYQTLEAETKVLGIVYKGEWLFEVDATQILEEEIGVVLTLTPFYPEKGGQVGDTGSLTQKGALFSVLDCKTPYPDVILHFGRMIEGKLAVGDTVHACVDKKKRQETACNHSATHLLHLALVQVLGEHVKQAGSLVEPEKLRFDFHHHKAVTDQQLQEVQRWVNCAIRSNESVHTQEMSYEEVQKRSDIKQFFGDKYGSIVRLVEAGESRELCGGTHVERLGEIGFFHILKESSIAAGIRRIEAVTGFFAEKIVEEKEALLLRLTEIVKGPIRGSSHQLEERVKTILEEKKELELQLRQTKKQAAHKEAEALLQDLEQIGGLLLLCKELNCSTEHLTLLTEELTSLRPTSILALVAVCSSEKCHLILRCPEEAIARGIEAGKLIQQIAPLLGGSGGGKPMLAQAGGKNPKGTQAAFAKLRELIAHVTIG